MKIERAEIGPFGTNCYLLSEAGRADCAVVDAPPGAPEILLPVLQKRGLALAAILLTHGHWDHNGGVAGLLAGTAKMQTEPPQIFAHIADRDCHENPQKFMNWFRAAVPGLTAADFPPFRVSHWTSDEESFPLLGKNWLARHVPGHCPGSLVFYCAEQKTAWTGDAIFAGSIGRTDLPGGSFAQLEASIREKIFTLPDDTKLFPGHGPETSVGEEKISNPFVRP